MLPENRKGRRWRNKERKAVPHPSGSDRESGIAVDGTRWDDQCRIRRRTKPSPWLDHRHLVKVISKSILQVHSDSGTPKLPAETWFVPGFATSESRATAASVRQVVKFPGSVDQTRRSIQDRQKSVYLICTKVGQRRTTIVQPWNNQQHNEGLHDGLTDGSTDAYLSHDRPLRDTEQKWWLRWHLETMQERLVVDCCHGFTPLRYSVLLS